jgi:hypothetical protein
MANNLNLYDPLFYANEGLIQLEKALGMAGRVHRGHDKDPQQKGSTIKISKPGTFTAQDAPSVAQDLNPDATEIKLDKWKEVKFKLTDKELTFTTEKIIEDHIRPAAVALADNIDQALNALYADVPWYHDAQATPDHKDIVDINTVLFNNNVPMDESMLHLEINGAMYGAFLKDPVFSQAHTAADGGAAQMRGTLGRKFGFEIFRNQNVKSHTPGVAADATGALTGAVANGATTLGFDAVTLSGTFKKGDSFVIAGDSQRYVFSADATADGAGVVAAATFFPPAVKAYADNDVITISLDTHVANLAFHRNAFALAMAPLTDIGRNLGARIETVVDPITNLALRARMYYVGDDSEVKVALDVLYGVKTLDPNLAARLRG